MEELEVSEAAALVDLAQHLALVVGLVMTPSTLVAQGERTT